MKDANHATIERAFLRHKASVIDLSNVGHGVPDMLVGFCNQARLIEVKRPERKVQGRALRSTKCGRCGHDTKQHPFRNAHEERACERKRCDCPAFELDLVEKTIPAGRVSKRQEAFHWSWQGCPIEVVETEADVDRVIQEMADAVSADRRRA